MLHPYLGPLRAHVNHSTAKQAFILGTLIALGAFGIDTYLPAFPAIAKSLNVTEGQVQLSLVSYFIAMAAGQMIYGPLSDRIGRRVPLQFGLGLFIVASVGVALTTSIEALIALRFIQGLGACAGMVLSRAIVRDIKHGEEAARLFALMLLVLGVSPIVAPLVGSTLLTVMPWQALFWFQAGLGLLGFALAAKFLGETHPHERRTRDRVGALAKTYASLLTDRRFILPVMIGGLSQSVMFAYLTTSPFLYMTHYKVHPSLYSILFALNAIGLIGTAQGNVYFIRKFGTTKLVQFATLIQVSFAALLLISVLAGFDSLLLAGFCLFLCIGVQGLIGPTTGMLSLEPYPEMAGAASAVSGTLQFALGAVSGSVVSLLFNGTAAPFALVVFSCAALGVVLSRMVIKPEPIEAAA